MSEPTPAPRPLLSRASVSWALYDVANSAYILMIPAVSFAVYYRSVVAAGRTDADLIWAVLVSASLAVAGILAPFVGALADVGGLRHRLFVGSTLVSCAATAGLFFVGPGDLILGGALFVVAQVSYNWAVTLYDSYLRDIAPPGKEARLSGIGWGMGYLGGVVCFALCYPFLKDGVKDENLANYRLAFVVTAAFFLAVAVPAFLYLPRQAARAAPAGLARTAYTDLLRTVRGWREHKETFKFLLAFYLLSDGIATVIYFTAIYLQTNFQLDLKQILMLTLVVQLIGVPATVLFGWLADKWSPKSAVFVTIGIWVAVIGVMALGTGPETPKVMAALMGLVLGSTQALCRSIYARMIPADRKNEFFGFNAFASKVSAVLGPLAFGLVTTATGSQRAGLLSLLVFFVGGALVLLTVRVPADTQPPDAPPATG